MKSFIKDFEKLNQIIDKNPNDPQAYFDRGLMVYTYFCDFDYSPYQKEKEDEDEWNDLDEELAFADFNKTIELDPNNAVAYVMLANLYFAECEDNLYCEEKDENLELSLVLVCQGINKALSLDKDCKEAFVAQGAICNLMREYDKALACYDKAIKIDGSYVKAIKERIDTYEYLDGGEYLDEVLDDYERLIEIEPYKISHYTNRATVFSSIERYDMALLDFSKAIKLDTNGSEDKLWNYIERADIYNHLGRYDDALSDYNKAIAYEMEEDDDDLKSIAYRSRAELFLTRDLLDEALFDFNMALILTPDCESSYYGRAQVHEKQGNSQQAAEDYKRASQITEAVEDMFMNEIEKISKTLENAPHTETKGKGLYIKVNNNKTN